MPNPRVVAALVLLLGACGPTQTSAPTGTSAALTSSGLRGNYGFLTDYACTDEQTARGRIDTMVQTFGISDIQFYDWFVDYSTPTSGSSWTDPWFHSRQICLQTIEWYVDEVHQQGAHAWAYVQSIAADDPNIANVQGIYPLLDANGMQYMMGTHPTWFANAALATQQVSVWGATIAQLGFDGVHWDTLGPIAGDYAAETQGFHTFLQTAAPLLSALGLTQNMNFVNVSWFDESLLSVIAFPYAEVWSTDTEQQYYATMATPAMQARSGVIAFYPSESMPDGWSESQTMIARFHVAPTHGLHYLLVGDGSMRLHNEYFPSCVPLSSDEIAALTSPR